MLIGRNEEIKSLEAALADPAFGTIVVQGFSGAGKTALVEAVLAARIADGAIVGVGKYADGSPAGAFWPILHAISQAVDRALDLLYEPAAGMDSLRSVLGPRSALLTAAGFDVPGFATDDGELLTSVGESGVQIIDAIARILSWLDGFGSSIILFIDDWQRAPADAQGFASLIARENRDRRCKIVFAERLGESRATATRHTAMTIVVGPLDYADRVVLLDSALGDGAGEAVMSWLGAGGSGLPLDLLEAARALRESNALEFNGGVWQIDSARAAIIDRVDFVDVVRRRVQALSPHVRLIGAAIALWGDRTELLLIAELLEVPIVSVAGAAQILSESGIVHVSDGSVSFVHDRLRAALLDAANPLECGELAGTMAERLWRQETKLAPALMRTALQLRLLGGVSDSHALKWRDRFAVGAAAARQVADSAAACKFAETALFLQTREISTDPDMNRLIAREALFSVAASRRTNLVRERGNILLSHCSTPRQFFEDCEGAIGAARMAGDLEQAWEWSMLAMRKLGVRLPREPKLQHLALAALRWRIGLAFHPTGHNPKDHHFDPLSRLSNMVGVVAFERQPLFAFLIAMQASARAHSLRLEDSIWAATDAFICASFRDYRRASMLGAVAAARPSKFVKASTLYRALFFGLIWTRPLASLRSQCLEIYNTAIAEGDLVAAALAVRNDALLAWRTAPTLETLTHALADDEARAERLADAQTLHAVRQFMFLTKALRGPGGVGGLSDNSVYGRNAEAARWAENMPHVRMEFLAIRGDWAMIVGIGERLKSSRATFNSHTGSIIWRFYESLARLRMGLNIRRGDMRFLRRAAVLNPVDHRCKGVLLEAEVLRTKEKREAALQKYSLAVDESARLSSRFEAAIIAEIAAYGARMLSDAVAATRYETIANSIWQSWGARAKVEQIRNTDLRQDPQLEARLMEAESQVAVAVRADRAKSRFLAEVGHELRTPLQAMQSLLDLAATGEKVDIGELRHAFGSFRNIVDDLTDLGALGGEAPLRLAAVDLADLIQSEATLFGVIANRKNLDFNVEIGQGGAEFVRIDGHRVRQVVRNLLSNAVKYVEHGEIVLRLTAENLTQTAASISIIVEDTGAGLPEGDLVRLFEPFERGGRDDTSGLGLGLPLSRRIAERMGGSLLAENRPEGGARFTFSFAAERTQTPAPSDVVTALKILLVEDTALNRRLIAAQLRSAGQEVVEAADGGEALVACVAESFDLIALDLGLPDISGFDLIERLRALVATPIVIMTASTEPAIDARAKEKGIGVVLRKPVSASEILDAIALTVPRNAGTRTEVSSVQAQDLAALMEEAHREICVRTSELLGIATSGNDEEVATLAHKLSGLAAQFGEVELAVEADLLETACRNGRERNTAAARIRNILNTWREGVSHQ